MTSLFLVRHALAEVEECGPMLWYKHCRVEEANYVNSNHVVSISLSLTDCKHDDTLDLNHEIDLKSGRRSAEDQESFEHIVAGSYKDIVIKAQSAKSRNKRVTLQAARLKNQNCKIVPLVTAKSITIEKSSSAH